MTLINREDAIDELRRLIPYKKYHKGEWVHLLDKREVFKALNALPSADAVQGWIPCNKQMPDELETVNVTWVNHLAPPYYKHIEGVPFVDSAVYYRGNWYWWDATVIDVLAEYGEDCNAEQIDKDIEILAWMPLPEPYKAESEEV